MFNLWFSNRTRIHLTPRKLAWLATIIGVAYFVCASPKTPLEFYDAGVKDQAAIHALRVERDQLAGTADNSDFKKNDELARYQRQMERIAILYDIEQNPAWVNSEKSSIIEGCYSINEDTKAFLLDNNEEYKAAKLAQDKCRRRMHDKQASHETPSPSTQLKQMDATIFRLEMEAELLRRFQCQLFWRNAR